MSTPVRKRNSSFLEDATPGFLSRLFSSSKRRRTTVETGRDPTATPARLPRIELASPRQLLPSQEAIPDVAQGNEPVAEVNGETEAQKDGSNPSSLSLGAPVLSLGSGHFPRRKRNYYRPNPANNLRRRRKISNRNVVSKVIDADALGIALQKRKDGSLFPKPAPPKTFFMVTGQPRLGNNQEFTRLPPVQPARKQVSFNNNTLSQQEVTPSTKPRLKLKRTSTPMPSKLSAVASVSPLSSTTSRSPVRRRVPRAKLRPDPNFAGANGDGPFSFAEPEMSSSSADEGESPLPSVDMVVRKGLSGDEYRSVEARPTFERKEDPQPAEIKPATKVQHDSSPDKANKGLGEQPSTKKTRLTTEKKMSWGAHMFKKDVWQCKVCLVQNNQSAKECASCETPRPGFENLKSDKTEAASKSPAQKPKFGFGFSPPPKMDGKQPTFPKATKAQEPSGGGVGFSFGMGETTSGGSTAKKPFSFGINSSETKSPAFKFPTNGSTPTKDGPKPSFSFGTTPKPTNTPPVPTELKKTPQSEPVPKRKMGDRDGTKAPATVSKPKVGGFSFGTSVAAKDTMQSGDSGTPGFSFGKPSGTNNPPSTFGGSSGAESTNIVFPLPKQQLTVDKQDAKPKVDSVDKQLKTTPAKISFGIPSLPKGNGLPDATSTGASALAAAPQEKKPLFTFGSQTPAPSADDSRSAKKTKFANDKSGPETPAASQFSSAPSNPFGSSTPASATPSFGNLQSSNGSANPFGASAPTATPTPTPGFSFGGQPAAQPTSFGAKAPQPPAAPSFGNNSKPSFGSGAAPAGSFGSGAAPSAKATPAPAFGTNNPVPPVPAFGGSAPAFGSAPNPPASFGAPQNSAQTGGFGAPNAPVFGSAPFGSNTSSAPAPPTFGASGGTNGAPSNFQFGSATPAPAPAAGGFSFGTPSAPTTFGNSNPGAPGTAPPGGGFGFGGASQTGTPATTTFGTSNGFGGPAAQTPAPNGGFTIGTGGPKSTGRRRFVRAKRPPGSSGRR